MNLNMKQVLAIVLAVLSVMSGSTAQLTDLLGVGAAKVVISVSSLAMSVISSVLAVLSGQSQLVRDVAAMPGVEKIEVNAKANQTLAAIALDPHVDKVAASPQAISTVVETAKGT